MNTYTTDTFKKYQRKRSIKHSLDTLSDEHSERYNKGNCVKQGWRMSRDLKRNWSGEE